MKIILCILAMVLSYAKAEATAWSTSIANVSETNPRMPGTFRVGALASGLTSGEGGSSIALLGSAGSGMFSFEVGVAHLMLRENIELKGTELENGDVTTDRTVGVTSNYVGLPVNLKWNYIEKPLATFYIKGGVMPISLTEQTRGDEKVDSQSMFAVGGIGGTSAISKSAAFVLDITSLWNKSAGNGGIPAQSLAIGVGLSYDL